MKSNALQVMLIICMLITLTACGDKTPVTEKEEYIRETEVTESITDSAVEETTEEISQSQDLKGAEMDEEAKEQSPMVEKPQILSLQETRNAEYEGIGDYEKLLLISEFNYVTFWEGAEKYPEMYRTLSETAGMITHSEEDLADSYADYGFIEDFRGMWGSNYDTQTGQPLDLTDVIKDMTQIPALVEKELNSHLWAGDFYSETVIQDYFQNTPEDGISWTLDYNGVTFYFGDGDLSEPGNGGQTATISFAEYPELFEEKYMNVPEAYMVSLPLDSSFFTDLDGDGTLEELNVTGFKNEEGRFYSEFGIYTDTDGYYHYEELLAYGYNPYYVKTAEGKHYLYLFCEESDADNRQMMLIVFDVSNGQFVRVGEMNAAPPYIPSDIFILPLNPNHILLDNFDSLEQDFGVYMVGENGMPVRK